MSGINGDNARLHRERKQKIHRRNRNAAGYSKRMAAWSQALESQKEEMQ